MAKSNHKYRPIVTASDRVVIAVKRSGGHITTPALKETLRKQLHVANIEPAMTIAQLSGRVVHEQGAWRLGVTR
jgi:hypothetical protein